MWLASWLSSRRRSAPKARRGATTAQLTVEALGERICPSALAIEPLAGTGLVSVANVSAVRLQTTEAPAAACEVSFEAAGTFADTGQEGRYVTGTLSGQTGAGAAFTGSYTKWWRGHNGVEGTITLTFDNGDSLLLAYHVDADADFPNHVQYFGTFEVIGGTGAFEGATGSGELVTQRGGGDFTMTGFLTC